MVNIDNLIEQLEEAWDEAGFLYELRQGMFNRDKADKFLVLIRSISIDWDDQVSGRFVSLIWYVPLFLQWQIERVGTERYEAFVTEVINAMEDALGIP